MTTSINRTLSLTASLIVLAGSMQNALASEATHVGTTFTPKSIVPVWSEEESKLTIYMLPVEVTPE